MGWLQEILGAISALTVLMPDSAWMSGWHGREFSRIDPKRGGLKAVSEFSLGPLLLVRAQSINRSFLRI